MKVIGTETVTDRKQFIKELKRRLKKRDLAISTLSHSDKAAALSMKERSYLWWRVGPSLRARSFVAIYVPLGATEFSWLERGKIRHIYRVAKDTVPAED